MKDNKKPLQGGEFIVRDVEAQDVFIPEEFNEEQRMIAQSCHDFTYNRVHPVIDDLEKHNRVLLRQLMSEAGELGLLGISVPEEYNGFGQNFVTSMLATEEMSKGFSFSVAYSAHTGIGTLPILYYGTEEQKQKYVTKLATGEFVGAYCLTEPGAGSDANGGTTKATIDGDNYIINGQKMWITNGGIADLLIVYAKIEDDKNLSAFLIDAKTEGVTINADEEKMGIEGSTTTQIFFNNVKVSKDDLLGERNGGFKIALYILNIGRIKLAGGAIGACKAVIDYSVNYANERKQFKTLISNFGAIKYKLAQQAILTFGTESATYRASQNIEDAIKGYMADGMDEGKAYLEGIKEFAIEAAMMKVFGSETLDYVVDEGVQIHGGMGYSSETKVEKAYRDARINRIFEGTNEINRLLSVEMLLRKAFKGEVDLLHPAKAVANELLDIPDFGTGAEGYYEEKLKYIKNFKKAILLAAGAALQKFSDPKIIAEKQELLMFVADMMIQTYVAESMMLRTQKMESMKGEEAVKLQKDMLDVFVSDAASKISKLGNDLINSFADGDEQTAMLMGIKRFTKVASVNVFDARRRIADKIVEENKYPF